jgi:hypothetical protein
VCGLLAWELDCKVAWQLTMMQAATSFSTEFLREIASPDDPKVE